MSTGPVQKKEIAGVTTSLPGPEMPFVTFHWEGGYEVINQDLRTANDCGQLWGAMLRSAMRCCAASAEACWDTCMWLCTAYLKPRHAAGLKSDVDPAVFRTVICSVRFEFHLNTNTHVLFLAFRWGGSMSACITAKPVPVAVWQMECTLLWQLHDLQRKEGYHHYIVCVYKTEV